MAEERLAFSVVEAARTLGLSERSVRALVTRGDLRSCRLGRRVLIPADGLRRLLGERDDRVSSTARLVRIR